jgi:hypothetical protein
VTEVLQVLADIPDRDRVEESIVMGKTIPVEIAMRDREVFQERTRGVVVQSPRFQIRVSSALSFDQFFPARSHVQIALRRLPGNQACDQIEDLIHDQRDVVAPGPVCVSSDFPRSFAIARRLGVETALGCTMWYPCLESQSRGRARGKRSQTNEQFDQP